MSIDHQLKAGENQPPITMKSNLSDWNFHSPQQTWSPPTDVFETSQEIVARVEIAGVHIEEFDIDFTDSVLTVRGNRSDISERKAFHRMEIRYGHFQVKLKISIPVKTSEITAEYKDGFLFVRLPKAEKQRIQISG